MTVTSPTSLAAAIEALAGAPESLVLAGGTDLMVQVNEGARRPGSVLSLARVGELRRLHRDGDDLVVGAGVTYSELTGATVTALVPALAQAARTVGSPQIRNAGTIGGNLVTASPAGDTLPVLVALGATVEVEATGGRRSLSVGEFLTGPKATALRPGELVTGVRVPVRGGPQEYLKVGVRNAMVIAVASVAVVVDAETRRVGVGLGSVGPTALAAPDACDWLATQDDWRDQAVVVRFARRVADAARPIDDHRSQAAYRRHAVEVLAGRALRRCAA
jgi:CO/xanthine dehydrogenase FAD-binding subunit